MNYSLLIIPLFTVAVALLGSLVTSRGMKWYQKLKRPSWTPPGKVIGLVWTILYIMATISALIFWQESPPGEGFLLTVIFFLANAFFNLLWSYLFFELHQIEWAIYDSVTLDFTILVLIVFLLPISTLSGLLLIPYFLWVSFATYLNYRVWLLNKSRH